MATFVGTPNSAQVPVPLPYSQMVLVMLTVYALVTPLIASQMVVSSVAATLVPCLERVATMKQLCKPGLHRV